MCIKFQFSVQNTILENYDNLPEPFEFFVYNFLRVAKLPIYYNYGHLYCCNKCAESVSS